MIVEVAGVSSLVDGTHPAIPDAHALQVDLDRALVPLGVHLAQVDAVTEGGDVLAAVRLAKQIEISKK